MNIFTDFKSRIATLIREHYGAEYATDKITVEPPRDKAHGDLATNAAMVLAKPMGVTPRDLAAQLTEHLQADPDIATVEIAGPGFINLRLAPAYLQNIVRAILDAGAEFGTANIGQGEKVLVEYVSANPTGPMHVGHARGAVVGDVIARLLARAGYAVTKEYYTNDAGTQLDIVTKSVLLRYREALGEDIGSIPEDFYPGEYVKKIGERLADRYNKKLPPRENVRDSVLKRIMEPIKQDLENLGIIHDNFVSEKRLRDFGKVDKIITELESHGLVYEGVLEPPKGKSSTDSGEADTRPQTIFKSTAFGDDSDRVLKKADGDYTYFAPDVAYHWDKYQRGFKHMINVWGVDHRGYVKRVKAALSALTDDGAKLDVVLCNLVKLQRNGKPVRMSKRAGDYVTLRELVDEVKRDAVRFMMLTRKNDAPLDFDFERVKEQSRDNPVFYVQYAHVRICSVLGSAPKEMQSDKFELMNDFTEFAPQNQYLHMLQDPTDLALIKTLAVFPRVLETTVKTLEVHRLAYYLLELAAQFHAHWTLGKTRPDLRFIIDDNPELSSARLALLAAMQHILQIGFDIIGIKPIKDL